MLIAEHADNLVVEDTARGPALVSVVVLTHNEEVNLPDCLDSLRGLPCAIYIVDSGSTDRTLEIASRYTTTVRHHAFENYAQQRNWALANLPLDTPWVLNIDADERLTPELREEIQEVLMRPPNAIQGFLLRRRTIFMGRWIRHGGHYPCYHLRLFRRGSGRCEVRRYDQHFLVDGPVERLRHDFLDVVASSLLTWTVRHARWASMEAGELVHPPQPGQQVQPDVTGTPIQRRRWWRNLYNRGPLFGRALAYWVYRYVVRLGFLDGKEGLIFHFLQGFWFRFLVDSMMFEAGVR